MADEKVHSHNAEKDSVQVDTKETLLDKRSGVGTTSGVINHTIAGAKMFSATMKNGYTSRSADGQPAVPMLSNTCCHESEDRREEAGNRNSQHDSDMANAGNRNKIGNRLTADDSQGKASDPSAGFCPTHLAVVGTRPDHATTAADVTSAVLCPQVLDEVSSGKQLRTTAIVTPASPVSAFLCPSSHTLPTISPATASSPPIEPQGEAMTWPENLISVIRTIIQEEVGRADQPNEPGLPLPVTPHLKADSPALSTTTVSPNVVGPAEFVDQSLGVGPTKSLEALRLRPVFQFPHPSSLPTVCSSALSSSPISSSSYFSSSSSSSSQLSPLSTPTLKTVNPFMSTSTFEDFTKAESVSPRVAAQVMSSSRLGQPAERRSSVHFRELSVSSTSAAGNGANSSANAGGGGTQSRDPTAAACVLPRGAVELTSVDRKWGVLFDAKGQATKRFMEVMHSLAKFIIEKHLPEGSIVIVPEKLHSFYSFPRIDGESGFYTAILRSPSRDLHRKISELYQDLGCSYHLVQAKPASRPHIPALTPDGFARWMTLNAQAFPDEEALRLDKVISSAPLEAKSALDGKIERLPKQLSRYLLPSKPDHQIRDLLLQAVKRHFGESCLGRPALQPVPGRDEAPDRVRFRRDSTSRGRPTSVYYGREEEDEGRPRSRRQNSAHRHDSHRGSYSQRDRRSPSRARERSQSKAGSRARNASRSGGGNRQPLPPSQTVAQRTSSRRASFAGGSNSPPVVINGNAGPPSGTVRSYRSSYPEVHRTVGRSNTEDPRRRPASIYGPPVRASTDYVPGPALSGSLSRRFEETALSPNGRDRERDRNTGRSRETEGRLSGVSVSRSGSSAALAAASGVNQADSATDPRQDSPRHDPRANIRRRIRPEEDGTGSGGGSRRTSAIASGGNGGEAGRDVSQTWDEYLRET